MLHKACRHGHAFEDATSPLEATGCTMRNALSTTLRPKMMLMCCKASLNINPSNNVPNVVHQAGATTINSSMNKIIINNNINNINNNKYMVK
eukprot:6492124-Amphidinium_carterae.2